MMTVVGNHHNTHRSGWLRAMVLGANDGLISVASLTIGIASAGAEAATILLGCAAAISAGAISMAAGEYVSVKSQADAEAADLALERRLLHANPAGELQELTSIYERRGLTVELARTVAEQLTLAGALEAHARDEIGLSPTLSAKPLQAAFTSGVSFLIGSLIPLFTVLMAPEEHQASLTALTCLMGLAALGALSGWLGGASLWKSSARVLFWGALAMVLTAAVGRWLEVAG
jgi:VIT1/CCC1 family predicted Fe2+/Mn2+ transporter